ncbi:MAG: hypothetical protein EXS12_08475 [Phycisphaerales bacterium]|nr:hypothetical protein [Phycisphaerales bacterium]
MKPICTLSRQIWISFIYSLFVIVVITPARAELCSVADAQALFQASRQWLDQQMLNDPLDMKPPDFSKGVTLSPTFSATAAGVVLRLNGRPVGQAWVKQNSDSSLCLAEALLKALQQASNDRVLCALPADMRAHATQELALEIELVGDARPFTGDRLDVIAARVDNSRQAMAIRAGDQWAFSLPSLQQSQNQTQLPWYTMVVMAREVGVEAGADKKFLLPEGVVIYRADTRRLAQIAAKAPAFEVSRGMLTVPLSDITAHALDAMAIAIAAHLESRIRNPEDLSQEVIDTLNALGPAGEYQPALAVYAQQVCSPMEQAMSAFAMAEFSECNFSQKDRSAALEFAISTLNSLQRVVGEEKNPLDHPVAAAACLLACQLVNHSAMTWGNADTADWQKKLRTKVVETFQLQNFADVQTWSLCAAALAQESPDEVAKALNTVWQIRPVEKLLSASPWLLLAEQRVGKASDHEKAKKGWNLLQIMLVQNQLTQKLNPDIAADLVGGWPITTNGVTGATAQSSRPAWALALALNPKLFGISNAKNADMESLKLALRFLKQLQVDQASCYAFRDPSKAIGGIRASPWDSSQPLGANATTLLAILEARALFALDSESQSN